MLELPSSILMMMDVISKGCQVILSKFCGYDYDKHDVRVYEHSLSSHLWLRRVFSHMTEAQNRSVALSVVHFQPRNRACPV